MAAAAATDTGAPLIEMAQLHKTYGLGTPSAVRALSGIDLTIADGEFVSIVGPSGCGKSTLLRILAGLDEHEDGELTLAGSAIVGPSTDVGFVFQAANLLPWLTVRDNISLPLRVGKRARGNAADIDGLLAMTGLADFGQRYPYELSGGMQQRAGICRALVRNPKILLMDEPFGALDALTREHMNLELQRIWLQSGKTVILITHSISEAVFLGDRVVVMSARPGRIVADIKIDIPRPRSLDAIIGHPEYQRITRDIRQLLNAQGEVD